MIGTLLFALSLTSGLSTLSTQGAVTTVEVPYLSQTDLLCGGAAAAMVFRYWGDFHADVQQFASLVDVRAGGIASDTLVQAVESRGWRGNPSRDRSQAYTVISRPVSPSSFSSRIAAHAITTSWSPASVRDE